MVYNYYFNAWSTWANLSAVSGCVWNGTLCLLTSNGTVMMQDTTNTVFCDTFSSTVVYPVQLSVTTPWLKLNDLQGYQSIFNCLVLGTLQGPHVLQAQVAYDYNPAISASAVINSTAAGNRWGNNPIWGSQGVWGNAPQFANYQFQLNLNNNRCEAIQLTLSDVNNTAYSQAFSLNGLVLECLALPGPMRLPTSQKIGLQ